MKTYDRFPRQTCRCGPCATPCRVSPGFLGVGDLERIRGALAVKPDDFDSWALERFAAGDGIRIFAKGREFNIPVISPAQLATVGDCVFLTAGQCIIHAEAPIGCSHVNQCDTLKSEGLIRLALLEIADEWRDSENRVRSPYVALWRFLTANNRIAIPARHRAGRLSDELTKLRRGAQTAQPGGREDGDG